MQSVSIKIDLRLIIVILLGIIAAMLLMWQPWQAGGSKTIKVTGEGTISQAPDEFVFNPSYQKSAVTSQQAVAQVSELGNSVVDKLKSLGLDGSMIKTNVSSGQEYKPLDDGRTTSQGFIATYNINATVRDKDQAKKVLDYIATTPVLYSVSPQTSFSKENRAKLETEARTKALKNARTKAEQTARELGLRLGKVTSVSELNQSGGPIILEGRASDTKIAPATPTTQTPNFETGTQDLNFSLTVEYQIR